MHPKYMMFDCLPASKVYDVLGLSRRHTYILPWANTSNLLREAQLEVRLECQDDHWCRRPTQAAWKISAQKVEVFVGCESLPYKVSGHIFWPFRGRKWRARLATFHNMNWQDSLAFYILLNNPIKGVNQSNGPHNALLECQAGLWHGHKFANPQFFRRIPRPDFPKVLFGHDGIPGSLSKSGRVRIVRTHEFRIRYLHLWSDHGLICERR